MNEFNIAQKAALFLGIDNKRLLEIQNENIVNFSQLVNLGIKIKAMEPKSNLSILKLEYSKIQEKSNSFGDLHKLAFNWYFGINSNLNPYSFQSSWSTLHKVGFILSRSLSDQGNSNSRSKSLFSLKGNWDFVLR